MIRIRSKTPGHDDDDDDDEGVYWSVIGCRAETRALCTERHGQRTVCFLLGRKRMKPRKMKLPAEIRNISPKEEEEENQ